jgi:putative oxidoreductase
MSPWSAFNAILEGASGFDGTARPGRGYAHHNFSDREWLMLSTLIRTTRDLAGTITRVGLGLVILPHGLQKAFGWFGGPGLGDTLGFFEQGLGIPSLVTLLVVLTEAAGPALLIAGLLTRLAAAAIAVVMIAAILLVHGQFGFFMNWSGSAAGEGFEYHILAIALALAVVIRGGGALSVDLALTRRSPAPEVLGRLTTGAGDRPSRVA